MNLENIKGLAATLSKTGFGNLTHKLIQCICCRPVQFVLTESVNRESDHLTCQLYFERKGGDYSFAYYDAAFIKELSMPALTINHIVLQELEKRMGDLDWKAGPADAVFRLDDPKTWERERDIEAIVSDLAKLAVSEEGKLYSDILKARFWTGTSIEQLTGSLAAIRSRLEISQRFYITNGDGITINEALRFLQNRWIEKRQRKRREVEKNENNPESAQGPTGKVKGGRGGKLKNRRAG